MAQQRAIKWHEVDKVVSGLDTDIQHEILVQREAIPLVFVPGIMGSRLKRAGTDGQGKGPDRLPNMRWNPGSKTWMLSNFAWRGARRRKDMLVGRVFSSDFLEVDDADPIGDGFQGIFEDYRPFLETLKSRDWCGPLHKVFEFPVFAVGYNWTDDIDKSGHRLAQRIQEIIQEAKEITGLCEKVIVITHSMGGLVTRAASELQGAREWILGIIHGVQPVTGAPAAYWRIKAGFEGNFVASAVLGNSGPTVTAVLGNIPGGLELLPNKDYLTNDGAREWLKITENGQQILALPKSDPYEEIYRVPAVVKPQNGETRPSTNTYWGLVDPDLLNPGKPKFPQTDPSDPNDPNAISKFRLRLTPWLQYLDLLGQAETFHNTLGKQVHPKTFCFRGTGHSTADVVEFRIESNWVRSDPYPTRGFRGFFINADGGDMQAVLQNPLGDGDGTVPASSARAINQKGRNESINVEHQPAYEDKSAQDYTIKWIITLCKQRYDEHRRKLGDFPLPKKNIGLA